MNLPEDYRNEWEKMEIDWIFWNDDCEMICAFLWNAIWNAIGIWIDFDDVSVFWIYLYGISVYFLCVISVVVYRFVDVLIEFVYVSEAFEL